MAPVAELTELSVNHVQKLKAATVESQDSASVLVSARQPVSAGPGKGPQLAAQLEVEPSMPASLVS
jgi:hypothetical protein